MESVKYLDPTRAKLEQRKEELLYPGNIDWFAKKYRLSFEASKAIIEFIISNPDIIHLQNPARVFLGKKFQEELMKIARGYILGASSGKYLRYDPKIDALLGIIRDKDLLRFTKDLLLYLDIRINDSFVNYYDENHPAHWKNEQVYLELVEPLKLTMEEEQVLIELITRYILGEYQMFDPYKNVNFRLSLKVMRIGTVLEEFIKVVAAKIKDAFDLSTREL